MLKYLWIFFTANLVLAEPLSEKLIPKKYYYTALNEFFLETWRDKATEKQVEKLENLLFFTGVEILEDYDPKLLNKYPSSSTHFILGRLAKQNGQYKDALDNLKRIHPEHRFFPEAQLIKSHIFEIQNQLEQEIDSLKNCHANALKFSHRADNDKNRRYYFMLSEICQVNIARQYYKSGRYKEAIVEYDKISKQSYKWPYIILEKAWAYYHLGDYNRTLGLLVTYKSPLLSNYFFPEAEYLSALSYFRLCLYEDALAIINHYYDFYRPKFQELETFLNKSRHKKGYFFELMLKQDNSELPEQDFVSHMISRIRKQPRFSIDMNTIHKLKREISEIKGFEKLDAQRTFIPHLESVLENMMVKVDYHAKKEMLTFLESVPFYSSELFKLNLEILSRKKDLVYAQKKLVADRARGDLSQVRRSRHEQFWNFTGEFWADELGDYSMGLKANCNISSDQKQE